MEEGDAGDRGLKVLGISGSLRRGSYNRMLLLNALRRLPEDVEWSIAEIRGIPVLDEDEISNPPEEVLELEEVHRGGGPRRDRDP
ncbi:NADPH-dependent FMN reductase [Conexivisphaera calida]|nr:NAD(P)H-dependent oxidoreductase [Conexivisphaera calida]